MLTRTKGVQEVIRLIAKLAALSLAAAGMLLMGACGNDLNHMVVQSLLVTPASATMAPGAHQQFTATALYRDGHREDKTNSATWSSSSSSVATIDSSGMANGIAAGSTTITAQIHTDGVITYGSGTGTASLVVQGAVELTSITVAPSTASLLVGAHQQYTATGTYSDNSQSDLTNNVTWSTSAPTLASISSTGLATALDAGSVVVTASMGSVSGTGQLTITSIPAQLTSITVAPSTASLPVGGHQQYTATGNYSDDSQSDLTNSVTWSTSAPSLASISTSGLAIALGPGSIVIQATLGSITGTAQLTVNSASGGGSSTGTTGILTIGLNGSNVDAAYQPYNGSFNGGTVQVVNLDSNSSDSALITSIPLPANYMPSATAADQNTLKAIVISYASADIQVIDANTNTVIHTFTAPVTGHVSFSGSSCVICAALFNPNNDLALLDTAQGYYTMDVSTGTFTPLVTALAAENFALDSTAQLILNPTYGQGQQYSSEVQILDLKHNSLSTNAGLDIDEPDAAAVDLNTGVAVVVDEDGARQTLINLNQLVASFGAWGAPTQLYNIPGCVGDEMTMMSIDSSAHVLFSSDEYGSCAAVETLPASAPSGPPPNPTSYAWGHMPNTPDSNAWQNGGDPHGLAVFASVVDGKHYGFLVDAAQNWIAKVDLNGVLGAAPQQDGSVDLTPYVIYLPTTH